MAGAATGEGLRNTQNARKETAWRPAQDGRRLSCCKSTFEASEEAWQSIRSMKETLQEINALREAGVIGQSAIGGAMGATFYLEPISTYDLDIFVLFDSPPLILTLTPIYDFLRARGHEPEGDAVSVCGWPVQFLPAESPLLKEAVEQAVTVDFEGVPTRVMTAEHLAAIALQTGRAKDFARLVAFVESGTLAADQLTDLLARHHLADAWSRFETKYLTHP